MFNIKENLKKLPDRPGVYMHKDSLGNIIYIGKAISLKNRVRQYFQSERNLDSKSRAMVSHIDSFEYITCGSEVEALILENNLIKKHQPKYNILLRDDKTYPYIKITGDFWPRIEKTRKLRKDGGKYFGPYTDVGAVNNMVDLLSKVYKLKKCTRKTFPKGFKPCLNYYINQCNAMCIDKENRKDYLDRIKEIENFLKGGSKDLISFLESEMLQASDNLQYERAATYRDYVKDAKALQEKQRVALKDTIDMDLIILGHRNQVLLFKVEKGVLVGREIFYLDNIHESRENLLEAFIKQYYSGQSDGVGEILIDEELTDKVVIEEFLSSLWDRRVKITQHPKGEKKGLLELAKQDALETINIVVENEENKRAKEEKLEKDLNQLIDDSLVLGNVRELVHRESGEIISLFSKALRIEAYDISNTSGQGNVGVMVVFQAMKKLRKAYRKFKIKSVEGVPDDYSSMREMLYRRLQRAMSGDESFLPLPKIMLIDGGLGHIAIAKEVVEGFNLPITVVGMVKDSKHRTDKLVYYSREAGKPLKIQEVALKGIKEKSLLYSYIGNIQEEVHRFAIEYHRGIRSKAMFSSELDSIKGIGPKKRGALLAKFGNVDNIKIATAQELTSIKEINSKDAQSIIDYFSEK